MEQCLCPREWKAPLSLQHMLRNMYNTYFQTLLPNFQIIAIDGMHRKYRPCCLWRVTFSHSLDPLQIVETGLYDTIYTILNNHKPVNCIIDNLTAINARVFSVDYIVQCECECVGF